MKKSSKPNASDELEVEGGIAQDYLLTVRQAGALTAKELDDPILWAESVWCIRGNQEKAYDFAGFEYLREPLTCPEREVVMQSSAASGKTEAFLTFALFNADKGESVLYAMESDKKVSMIVQERVNTNIRRSPYLATRCLDADNIALKAVGDGIVFFIGAGTESAASSYHAATLILDEYDLMKPELVADMEKRTASFPRPRIRKIGNPKHPKAGINLAYIEGTQEQWNLTCPKCKHEAPLLWRTHVDQSSNTVRCPACQAEMDRLAPGRWIANNPGAKVRSFHIHALMSPVCDIETIKAELNHPVESRRRSATRMYLGEPYEDKESGISDNDLWAADGGDVWTKIAPGGFITVDPGKLFDVQIHEHPPQASKARCLWVGTVSGWRELWALIEEARVVAGLIDYGPELKEALEFCEDQRRLGRQFWRLAYKLNGDTGPDWILDKEDHLLIAANRTLCADGMVSAVRGGRQLYPRRVVKDPESRFAKHMKSPRRVIERDRSGILKARWEHEESNPDHQFHASLMAYVMHGLVGQLRKGGEVRVKPAAY